MAFYETASLKRYSMKRRFMKRRDSLLLQQYYYRIYYYYCLYCYCRYYYYFDDISLQLLLQLLLLLLSVVMFLSWFRPSRNRVYDGKQTRPKPITRSMPLQPLRRHPPPFLSPRYFCYCFLTPPLFLSPLRRSFF